MGTLTEVITDTSMMIPIRKWFYVSGVKTATAIDIYENAVLKSTQAYATDIEYPLTADTGYYTIGAHKTTTTNPWYGRLADLRVYDTNIPVETLQYDMAFRTDLILKYDYNSQHLVTDQSTYGEDGAFNNVNYRMYWDETLNREVAETFVDNYVQVYAASDPTT